eukprot:TRINITY_DN58470_c0_g5_i2.p1 TRINITY_DN58470_c0_g5~~TRINITY_DN58470_c0_g5_i2.p1  ORF type:complete len:657 (+),score=110.97 TRINITY_DN58470_c0_g5_i2:112-2082(+)
MDSPHSESPRSIIFPSDVDGIRMRGPMTWSPCGCAHPNPLDGSAHADHAGSDRILEVLGDVQNQLDGLLQGQCELRAALKAGVPSAGITIGSSVKLRQDLHDDAPPFPVKMVEEAPSLTLTFSEGQGGDPTVSGELPASIGSDPHMCSGNGRKDEGVVRRELNRRKTRLLNHHAPLWQRNQQAIDGWLHKSSSDGESSFSSLAAHGAMQPVAPSRSIFEVGKTDIEDKEELRAVFLHAEQVARGRADLQAVSSRLRSMSLQQIDLAVDSCIGFIIGLNAIFIGISMDAGPEHSQTVLCIDIVFSALFLMELTLKLIVNGFKEQFCGKSRLMNIFDVFVVAIDLVQLAMLLASGTDTEDEPSMPSVSIFRVVRLIRLVRILRLLRSPALQTLLMMMHGIIGGLPTLCWALLLFVSTVYVVALMSREFLGRNQYSYIYRYFDGVPRAMVTTFRCAFGECSTIEGFPIFEHVEKRYGIGFSVVYCLFGFVMSIGMFNVISAIFVQSTMSAASAIKHKQKKERLQDDELWSSRIAIIVRKISTILLGIDESEKLSDHVSTIYQLDVSCEAMDDIGADPEIRAALEDLDVDPEDHEILSDILDVDQNGSVVIVELLHGIKRLRGNPRRSDIVTVDLLCRSIQHTLNDVHKIVKESRPVAAS